jgi:hypothetical protein
VRWAGVDIANRAMEVVMKLFVPLTFCLLMGAAFAQDPPPTQTQRSDNSLTIVGCLSRGTGEGQYTISDSENGQKITFITSQPMESYLNHTVQITLTTTSSGSGDQNFTPLTVKSLSDTCRGS